jgi:glycosyltransferase involved in cell wall biosynthesis
VPGLVSAGGVPAVAAFFYRVLLSSSSYKPYLFSVPMSSRDETSLRLLSPKTWLRGLTFETGEWNGWEYVHVGANIAEIEFQRYLPKKKLTEMLSGFDLVIIVAGTPAWAHLTKYLKIPTCLQVATLTRVERQALFKTTFWLRRSWIKIMSFFISHLEKTALNHVELIFVENRWMYNLLRSKTDKSRVVFAPPGIDTKQFTIDRYRSDGYILSVGRLSDPRKNVVLLFKAYHRLKKKLQCVPPLLLAGITMPDSSAMNLADSLGIKQNIKMLTNLSTERLAKVYQKASMCVLSSVEEGLGIVILEAMASGIPVVATRCGGPETVVIDGMNGYRVPNGDSKIMAERMYQILTDPKQAEIFGLTGRKKIETEFSLSSASGKFLDNLDLLT